MHPVLIATGTDTFLFDGTLKQVQSLLSPPLFPPAIQGNLVYYVPKNRPTEICQGEKTFDVASPVFSIVVHKNNVYALSGLGLHVFDRYAETYTTLPLDEPMTKMASNGNNLLLANDVSIWEFDFERLALGVIAAPFLPTSFTLSPFGTLNVDSKTFVFRGGAFTSGSNDPQWLKSSSELHMPDGEVSTVQLEDLLFLSPVSDLDIPTECMVCMCELEDDPSVTLYCGHAFHIDCIRECLKRSEEYLASGDHISFQSAKCPGGCGKIVTNSVAPAASSIVLRKQQVEALSKHELRFEEGKTDEDLLFYVCSNCSKPFYGGLRICPRMMGKEPAKNPHELVCETCASDFTCPCHGRAYVLYKCRFCCNPAEHRSFGNYYVCNRCDLRWTSAVPDALVCDPNNCPLGGNHPGHTYAIGCGLCKNDVDWQKVVRE